MYIRFAVSEIDEKSNKELGLFLAISKLVREGVLYDYEKELDKELYNWFVENLPAPKIQWSKSKYYAKPLAISWFKMSATEHIAKMRQYAQILEAHDVRVHQLTTTKPGKIVYEDEYQVAAIPFNDTFQ